MNKLNKEAGKQQSLAAQRRQQRWDFMPEEVWSLCEQLAKVGLHYIAEMHEESYDAQWADAVEHDLAEAIGNVIISHQSPDDWATSRAESEAEARATEPGPYFGGDPKLGTFSDSPDTRPDWMTGP